MEGEILSCHYYYIILELVGKKQHCIFISNTCSTFFVYFVCNCEF